MFKGGIFNPTHWGDGCLSFRRAHKHIGKRVVVCFFPLQTNVNMIRAVPHIGQAYLSVTSGRPDQYVVSLPVIGHLKDSESTPKCLGENFSRGFPIGNHSWKKNPKPKSLTKWSEHEKWSWRHFFSFFFFSIFFFQSQLGLCTFRESGSPIIIDQLRACKFGQVIATGTTVLITAIVRYTR